MFYEDMWMEILSKLPVKSLLRFSCVSKYFQSLICDPSFVKLHLQNSSKNTHFLLSYLNHAYNFSFLFSSHINSCFEDPLSFFSLYDMPKPQMHNYRVFGSCNGLVCLRKWNNDGSYLFHLLNPATKKLFKNLHCVLNPPEDQEVVMLGFGYDDSRDTYKLVAIVGHQNSKEYLFRSLICSMEDKSGWRDIQNFPANPTAMEGDGIYLKDTLNWVGLLDFEYIENDDVDLTFNYVVIISLDLETEAYTQLLLPRDISGVIIYNFCSNGQELYRNEAPLIGVLGGCLSLFLHNITTNHLSIWQMKEFGNQNSWTPWLNTSLQDLGIKSTLDSDFLPLCMVENDRDIIIIHRSFDDDLQAVIYNQRDKTVKSRMICGNIDWIYPFHYVESLVFPSRLKLL